MAKNYSKENSTCPDQTPVPSLAINCWEGNSIGPDQNPIDVTHVVVQVVVIIICPCGNSLLIRAFCKFSNLRTASNVIVMSLCVADILIPVSLILHMMKHALKKHGPDDKIELFCKASTSCSFFLTSVIIFHLVLISVDRFVAIKFSLRYHSILTHRRALIASIAMWLWAALITLVFPLALKASHNDATFETLKNAFHPCQRVSIMIKRPNRSQAYAIFMITQLVIPLVIILCSYSYIFIVSYKHRNHIAAQNDASRILILKQELKGARVLAITVSLCLLSILPSLIFMCLRTFAKLCDNCYDPKIPGIKKIAYNVAMSMNAICNPLIYGLGNQQVRRALRRMFKALRWGGNKGKPSETTEAYRVFFLLTILGIPLVTILCSYIYIFRVSRNHRKRIRTQDNNPRKSTIIQELKGAGILAIVAALCLLSFLPLFLFISLRIARALPDDPQKKGDYCSYSKPMKQIKMYAYIFALGLNAICNPLVYGLGNQQLRSAIRRLLKRTSVISPA
ncbi:trace amine-associated receptor 13c-like [Montipora capricornis]|uniref:trace amine-associated receptor 13c-like n=1 Tax=Montipora capricornis TaxID=246305 RepID=UPI0035F1898E